MIVFGGYNGVSYLNSGGRYNPATNSWTLTSVGAGVPTGRAYHVAVWTGSQMVVHGGYDGTNYLATGGRYSPATDTWLPTSTLGAEAPRLFHTAVWNGTEMLVWGGVNEWDYLVRGGRYDPAADNWVLMGGGSTMPSARYFHEAVWTGSEMLITGGGNEYYTPDAWRYVPATTPGRLPDSAPETEPGTSRYGTAAKRSCGADTTRRVHSRPAPLRPDRVHLDTDRDGARSSRRARRPRRRLERLAPGPLGRVGRHRERTRKRWDLRSEG